MQVWINSISWSVWNSFSKYFLAVYNSTAKFGHLKQAESSYATSQRTPQQIREMIWDQHHKLYVTVSTSLRMAGPPYSHSFASPAQIRSRSTNFSQIFGEIEVYSLIHWKTIYKWQINASISFWALNNSQFHKKWLWTINLYRNLPTFTTNKPHIFSFKLYFDCAIDSKDPRPYTNQMYPSRTKLLPAKFLPKQTRCLVTLKQY